MSPQAASRRKRSTPSDSRSTSSTSRRELPRREIAGLVVAMLALLFTLALMSHRADEAQANWIGTGGRFVAETSYILVGLGSWALAALALLGSWNMLRRVEQSHRVTAWLGGILLMLAGTGFLDLIMPSAQVCAEPLGGMLGDAVSGAAIDIVGRIGGGILLLTSFAIGVILATGISVVDLSARLFRKAAVVNPAPVLGSAREGLAERFAGWKEARALRKEERKAEKEARRAALAEAKQEAGAAPDEEPLDYADEDEIDADPAVAGQASAPGHDEGAQKRAFQFTSTALADDESWAPEASDEESQSDEVVRPKLKTPPEAAASAALVANAGASVGGAPAGVSSATASSSADGEGVAIRHPAGEHARDVLQRLRRQREEAPASVSAVPEQQPAVLERNAERFAPSQDASYPPPYTPEDSAEWRIENPMESPTRDVSPFLGGSTPPASAPEPVAKEETPDPSGASRSAMPADDELEAALAGRSAGLPDAPSVTEVPMSEGWDNRAWDDEAWGDQAWDDDDADDGDSPTRPVVRPIEEECAAASPARTPGAAADEEAGPMIVESDAQRCRRTSDELEQESLNAIRAERVRGSWEYPPLSYLRFEESETRLDEQALRATASALEEALADHKVNGRVTGICPGPIVTRFEFEPEPGTKLNKIANLSRELAMRLRAETVRIIAPIPGKGCVGVELPNDERETVYLKEILADKAFTGARSKLTMALGKDVEGFPVVANLAKMPHLLVAGTTGSGKSVSVNAMITSLLYNASPDDVRLILIDPKQLEFAIYEDVPHLLLPVVTDVNKAATALQWAVQEMERRYGLMKDLKVRNVEGYNEKLESLHQQLDRDQAQGRGAESRAAKTLGELDDDDRPRHRHMPFIVVVVDEFADLIMNVGKDVEVAVARLAQKARAAGIHVILATQRPSTDVVTGLIKSNFPTRISFRLISGTDSRVILDGMGAENLLGMGDMLFRPPGSSELVRVHGAFVEEEEIEQVVDFLKEQREAEYDESILSAAISGEGGDDEDVDELFEEAVECCVEAGEASISMIQRRLRIGYNRAARIIDEMERQGIIGPASGGSSRREVLMRR